MSDTQGEMKRAVESGYWHLYRYNPLLANSGQNPFILDSAEPSGNLMDFLRGETRYAQLEKAFPEDAAELFKQNESEAKERFLRYKALAK